MKPLFTYPIGSLFKYAVRLVIPALLLFMAHGLTAQNVGIGTTSPIAKLHVVGDSKFQGGNMDLSGNSINNVNNLHAATLTITDMLDLSSLGQNGVNWPSYLLFNDMYSSYFSAGTIDFNYTNTIYEGPAFKLNVLSDVDLATTPPVNGDVLTYDGSQWVPMAGGGGGGGGSNITFDQLTANPGAEVDLSAVFFDDITFPDYLEINSTQIYVDGSQSFYGELKAESSASVNFNNAATVTMDNKISIDAMNDVDMTTTTPSDGNVLTYSSGQWVPMSASGGGVVKLDDLSDVTLSPPPYTGQVLTYQGGQWQAVEPSSYISFSSLSANGGSTIDFSQASSLNIASLINLDALSDVQIGAPSSGDVLTYSGGAGGMPGFWAPAPNPNQSDVRFKKDIQPLANSLGKVLQLRGVEYNWRKDEFPNRHFQDKHQIGFIAQELEAVYPDLVNTDAEGYKSVDYQKMGPILVEAIKDQQAIIDAQQTELAELKARVEKAETTTASINELMSRLEKLEGAAAASNNPLTSKE